MREGTWLVGRDPKGFFFLVRSTKYEVHTYEYSAKIARANWAECDYTLRLSEPNTASSSPSFERKHRIEPHCNANCPGLTDSKPELDKHNHEPPSARQSPRGRPNPAMPVPFEALLPYAIMIGVRAPAPYPAP